MRPTGNNSEAFSCMLCGAEGFSSSGMEEHLQQDHGAGSSASSFHFTSSKDGHQSQPAKSSVCCVLCNFTAPSNQELQAHIKFNHFEQNACPLCDLVFIDISDAERHLTVDHSDILDGENIEGSDDSSSYECRQADEDGMSETVPPRFSSSTTANQGLSLMSEWGDLDLEESLRLSDCPYSDHSSPVDDIKEDNPQVILVQDSFEEMDSDNVRETEEELDVEEDSNLSLIFGQQQTAKDSCKSDKSEITGDGGAKPKALKAALTGSVMAADQTVNEDNMDTGKTDSKKDGKITASSTSMQTFDCPFCSFRTMSEEIIHFHVNNEHMKQDDYMDTCLTDVLYTCPFCGNGFDSPRDLAHHVNLHHPEQEIGGGSSQQDLMFPLSSIGSSTKIKPQAGREVTEGDRTSSSGTDRQMCPVCGIVLEHGNTALLAAHVNEHFQSRSQNTSEDLDRKMAEALQDQERKKIQKEMHDLQQTQTQFGMDTTMTAKQQFDKNLERAVTKGQMSVSDFHQRRIQYMQSEQLGVDDGSTQVAGIIERLQAYYNSKWCPRTVARAILCNSTYHYSGAYGDRGWGCGYRNFQMLLSCLMNDPTYLHVLFSDQDKIPSIRKLQHLIENAWQAGFDPQGCGQLGGKVVNTRKWIGATEIVATLSSLHIKCQLLDFHAPSGPDNTHPVMINWVRDYFKSSTGFIPPLYLQHQGHSRTIIGVEELKNGGCNLLLFDPGVSQARMQQFLGTINFNTLQAIRKTTKAFRARQYQIVAVTGVLNEREFQASKLLRSVKLS